MKDDYKIIVSNKSLSREFVLPDDKKDFVLGTAFGCDARLHKSLFFEEIELKFVNRDNQWALICSDQLYIDVGDSRKLKLQKLNHGDYLCIKYLNSDATAFFLEFLIDFDNIARKYERKIDISSYTLITIGASDSCIIRLASHYVERSDLVKLERMKDALSVDVAHSSYGVFINGSKMNGHHKLVDGDFLSVSDFSFYFKENCLWTEIREDMLVPAECTHDYRMPDDYPNYCLNSRLLQVVDQERIQILDPPSKPQNPKNNILVSLLPSLGMLLTSGLMASRGGSMVIFSVISGALAIITSMITFIQSRQDLKKESKKRIDTYNEYVNSKQDEIERYRSNEQRILNELYPDIKALTKKLFQFSDGVFDRHPEDADFLHVRLGCGETIALKQIEYKKQERLEIEDELQLIPQEISEQNKYLANAPVICDLKENCCIGIIGTKEARYSLLKNTVFDICLRHFYTDIQLFFIASKQNNDAVYWLRFLPFVYNSELDSFNIACDDDGKNRLFDYLYNVLSVRKANKKAQEQIHFKHLIVFFYNLEGFLTHPLSRFKNELKELSVSFVFFSEQKKNIPDGCSSLIFLTDNNSGKIVSTADQSQTCAFHFEALSEQYAKELVSYLAPIKTEEISLEGALTKNISLFELLNIIDTDDLDLKKRWASSMAFRSMAAPIGIAKNGVVSLDLHDKAHGPHGLVAGTTGSGKSEILQTYILSIATLFHPYEISFVIIDFKGGGMANQFENLPHLLGAITNIDGKEINRSLKSIKAELQKRQRLFAEAGVNHIDKYIRAYKDGKVSEPIPHLVLIVDEFAELKAEQPDFMKELISAARIGRSLGVHLILATQKPSGQVDEQIWSNSRFKLCLKVQSPEDSNEVLKTPLAAEIKEPGRAYLQVGNNEIFELFQSAYSGASSKMDGSNLTEFSLLEINEFGKKTVVYSQKKPKGGANSQTQLEAIVSHVNCYCKQNAIAKLPNICLPSLQKTISFPDLSDSDLSKVGIGLFDDPDNQRQDIASIDIISKNTVVIGSAQHGKTMLFQNIIRTIATTTSPMESTIYIIDFASMALKVFEPLNHVGGVVCSSDDEKLKNLFKLLINEISARKEKMIQAGVSSFLSYVEAGNKDLPHIYLFIDNLTALIELYLQDDDILLNIIREGLSVGITVLVANAQTSGIGYKYLSNFANKIALYCNDSMEYNNLLDTVPIRPDDTPGRCILELGKRVLECQTFLAFDGEKEFERTQNIQHFISEMNLKYAKAIARKIPFIPTVLTCEDINSTFNLDADAYQVPIGLTYSEVEPFYLDLRQMGIMGLCGKENRGHKNFISVLLNYLRESKENHPARVAVFDDIARKLSGLRDDPLVETYTVDATAIRDLLLDWHSLLEKRYEKLVETGMVDGTEELLLLIIQNNDVAKTISDDYDLQEKFNEMLSRFQGLNFAVLFSNYNNAALSYDAPEPLRRIKQDQHLLFLDDLDNLKVFDVPYDYLRQNRKRLGVGDAYYIWDNEVTKLKVLKADT